MVWRVQTFQIEQIFECGGIRMLSIVLWVIAVGTALAVVVGVSRDAKKSAAWEIALRLIYGAFVVVVLILAALELA